MAVTAAVLLVAAGATVTVGVRALGGPAGGVARDVDDDAVRAAVHALDAVGGPDTWSPAPGGGSGTFSVGADHAVSFPPAESTRRCTQLVSWMRRVVAAHPGADDGGVTVAACVAALGRRPEEGGSAVLFSTGFAGAAGRFTVGGLSQVGATQRSLRVTVDLAVASR